MKPINLQFFNKNSKEFLKLKKQSGVCFILRFDEEHNVPTQIAAHEIQKYYSNLLLISVSDSGNNIFGRIKKHVRSFSGIKRGVKTGLKLEECARLNKYRIDNLYAVYFEGMNKGDEIEKYISHNNGKKPCGNDRIK